MKKKSLHEKVEFPVKRQKVSVEQETEPGYEIWSNKSIQAKKSTERVSKGRISEGRVSCLVKIFPFSNSLECLKAGSFFCKSAHAVLSLWNVSNSIRKDFVD